MHTHKNFSAVTSVEQIKQKFPGVSRMPALQLSAFIVHLFVANLGTNLPLLPPCLPSSPGVVSNNLGFYKQASIICTTVLGVILKPPFCEAGFNLSNGLQTHSHVGLTTFPTLDKLPISPGFAISALFFYVFVCVLCYGMSAPTLCLLCLCVCVCVFVCL